MFNELKENTNRQPNKRRQMFPEQNENVNKVVEVIKKNLTNFLSWKMTMNGNIHSVDLTADLIRQENLLIWKICLLQSLNQRNKKEKN